MPQAPKTYAGRTARRKGLAAAALVAMLAIVAAVGGTGAYLTAKTDAYVNTFVSGLPTLGTLDGLVSVEGGKAIDGRSWKEGDAFQFAIEHLEDGEWVALGDAPATVAYEVDAQGNPVEGFDEFDLTEAVRSIQMEAGETRSFRAYEVIPGEGNRIAGVSYDPAKHYFDVTAADADGDGELEISQVSAAEPPSESDSGAAEHDGTASATAPASSENDAQKSSIQVTKGDDGAWYVALSFVNTYSASGQAQAVIRVEKSLKDESGQDMKPSGFEFELYAVDQQGAKTLVEAKATTAAGLADFALAYGAEDAGKAFEYELVEKGGGQTLAGMSYDATRYRFQIEVVDNLDGTLSAKVTDVPQDDNTQAGTDQGDDVRIGTNRGDEAQPENEYLATFLNVYDPADASAAIAGSVGLTGRDMAEGEFAFDVKPLTEGAPSLDLFRDVNDGAGSFSFGDASFLKVGTYVYEVTQDASAQLEGVTYDSSVHRIEVTVGPDADGDGTLDVAIKVLRNGVEVTDGTGIRYENRYEKPDDGGGGPGGGDPDDPDDGGDGSDEPGSDKPEEGGSDGGSGEPGTIPGGTGSGSLHQTGDSLFIAAAMAAAFAIVAAMVAVFAVRQARRRPYDR